MNIILFGPQTCGKGTQANILKAKLKLPHISTGDIFRENIKNNTPLGKKVKSLTSKGILVSDEVVIQIVKDRLAKPDCQNGFILDGFPRTKPQAVALDTFAPPDFVIELSITDTEATKRMLNRRTCSKSGHIYNLYTMPKPKDPEKCDSDSSPLFQREDDQAEPIKERLKLYHKETAPLKTHFTNKGVLAKVNGKQSIEKVTKDILAVLK